MDKKSKIYDLCVILFFFASASTFFFCYVFYQEISLLILFYAFLIISILITFLILYNRGKAYSETHKDEEKKIENKPHFSSGYISDEITEIDESGNQKKVSEDDLWDEHEFWN